MRFPNKKNRCSVKNTFDSLFLRSFRVVFMFENLGFHPSRDFYCLFYCDTLGIVTNKESTTCTSAVLSKANKRLSSKS